jgi:16S rRNA (guanine(966)-N(2))-methyltransferase RsmD
MAKEALFNILNNLIDIEEADCLDLFSGTGNITYELLSRGCRSLTSVDLHPKCVAFQKKTLAQLEGGSDVRVHRHDAIKFLRNRQATYDLIFADPPYDKGFENALLELMTDDIPLNPGGFFVLEHSSRSHFEHPWLMDSRKYGSVNFSIFERPEKQGL